MAQHIHEIDATILSGTSSIELKGHDVERAFAQAKSISIHPPTTLPETVTLSVSPVADPAASDYESLGDVTLIARQSGGFPISIRALKFVSTGNVAADRKFRVLCAIETE